MPAYRFVGDDYESNTAATSGNATVDLSGTSDTDFNSQLQAYVGSALNSVDALKAYYAAANQALQALQASEQQQWKAVQAAMETYVTILTTAVGAPYLGALFNSWFSQQPGAGAGPGYCATDPPASMDWPTLKQWDHYHDWGFPGTSTYDMPAQGTFEAYANPVLEYNYVLINNCFGDKAQFPPQLLANLVASWNATHQGPSQTLTRTGINPNCPRTSSGFDCSNVDINIWDPIARALGDAFAAKYPPGPGEFGIANNAPMNQTMTISVNVGAAVPATPKQITLRVTPTMQPQGTVSATATKSKAKAVAGGVAAVTATTVLTGIVYSVIAGKAWDWAFKQAWDETKAVFASGGPKYKLHEEFHEGRRRRSRR